MIKQFTVAVSAALLAGCASTASVTPTSATVTPATAASASHAGVAPSAMSALQLLKAADTSIRAATSFRISGTAVDHGKSIKLDMHFGRDSSAGTIVANGAALRLRYVDQLIYANAGTKYWRIIARRKGFTATQTRRLLKTMVGKWFVVRSNKSGLLDMVDRARFVSQQTKDNGRWRRHSGKTIHGVPTVAASNPRDGTVLYVRDAAPLQPVRVAKGNRDQMDFSDWNVPFEATPPTLDELVDLPS